MVRVGAKRRLDFDQKSTPTNLSKSPLGKRRQILSGSVDNNNESTSRTSKRSRITAIPYQTPESINKVLKAISKTNNAQKDTTKNMPLRQPLKKAKKIVRPNVPKSKPVKNSITRVSTKMAAKKGSKFMASQKSKSEITPDKKRKPGVIKAQKKAKQKTKKSEKKVKNKALKVSKTTASSLSTTDDKNLSENKKRKSKKETLNPMQNVTKYEKDPTFYSNIEIPYISTLAHSRLVLRATLMNDCKLLKQLITSDTRQLYSLCVPRSISDESEALEIAVKLQNKAAIKILLELEPSIEKKFGNPPDLLIHVESTGHGSRMMFGHGLRSVTDGRGGKEGHAALVKDDRHYNIHTKIPRKDNFQHIVRGIEYGVPYSMVEYLLSFYKHKNTSVMNNLLDSIDSIIRHGNVEVAGKLAADALKTGGYGFNFLHVEALSNTTEPFSDFKPVSVIKKSMQNSRLTPLHCAAINPNPHYLQSLLNSKPEYSIVDRQNWMLIHYASVCVGDGPLKFLLNSGMSTIVTEKEGNTPLHLAVSRKRLQNVRTILTHEAAQNVDLGVPNENETTSVKAIQVTSSLEKVNKNGMRPLHLAAKLGDIEIMNTLLKAKADLEKFTPAQFEKLTPLMIACQYGHLDVVQLLIKHGAKHAVVDRRGRTAIFHAVINGHAHVLSYLLRLGVNHQVHDSSGNTLAHYAAAYGWFFALKLLLEAGCDVVKGNDWKLTPIAIAFMKGHVGIVEMLVKEPGVEVNTPIDSDSGMTLLLKACSSTTLKSSLIPRLKFLVEELRADCTTPDFKGNNALHHLAGHSLRKDWEDFEVMFKNLSDAVKFLIDHGCDPNAVNHKNESPIMLACSNQNYWIAEKFIESGVKLNLAVDFEHEDTILHKLGSGAKSKHAQRLYEKLAKDMDNLKTLKQMAQMKNKDDLTPLFKVFVENVTGDVNEISSICNFVTFLVKTLDADVNTTRRSKDVQTSMLHFVVLTTYATKILPILKSQQLNLDPLDNNLRTPLAALILAKNSSIEVATFLIVAGANVNFKSTSDASLGLLLLLAMHKPKMFSLIPAMLSKGGDFREVDPKSKNSSLHFVAQNPQECGSLEAVAALIKCGANVNLTNKDGRTPLHLVVNSRGNETDVAYDIEDILLTAGADLRIKDCRGRTPVHYAFVKIGKPLEKSNLDPIELVMILLNSVKGINLTEFIKMPDIFGATPLHYAAMRGATISCSYFSSDMEEEVLDIRSNTAFGLAVWCGHESTALHFQQKGADFLRVLDTNIQIIQTQPDPNGMDMNNKIEDEDNDSKSDNSSKSYASSNSSMNSDDNDDDKDGPSTAYARTYKTVSLQSPEESRTRWIWSHKILQDNEIRKMKTESMKYPIFQEVVKRDWQGILYLMIAKLQSSGANISIPVSTAIKTQKLLLALKLIHRVKDSKELEQTEETLLHTLAKHCKAGEKTDQQVQVLKLLVEKGVNPKEGDSQNCSAISYAAMNQNYALVAEFEKVGLTIQNIRQLPLDQLGRTPFSALFWKLNEFLQIPNELTVWAASLLSSGALSGNVLTKYPFLLSPYPGVRCLVKFHQDHKTFPAYSPLIVAVINGRYNVVNWLCRHKSNTISCNFGDDSGRTPMMHACRLNDLKMVKLLLNPHSYNAELDTDPWNTTYTNWVRGKSSVELNLDAQDNNGWTALDYLVCPSIGESKGESYSYANVEPILTILNKAGASFTKITRNGKSPLDRAIEHKKVHIVNSMYKILKIPQPQQQSCSHYYGDNITIQHHHNLGPPIKDFVEETKKITLEKEDKMETKELVVLPDPLLGMELDNSEVAMDPVQNIPFDCVLTKVDVSYGMYGLYNFYKMQIVKQPKGKQLVVLFTQWGRVGTEGQYQKTPFTSEDEATKEFKKIFKAKSGNNWDEIANFQHLPKRYRLVHKDIKAKRPTEISVDFEKLEKGEKSNSSKLTPDVYNLIKTLAMAHKIEKRSSYHHYLQTSLEVSKSLPIISTEALHKANETLNRIKVILAEKHKMHCNTSNANYTEEERVKIFDELVAASEEFYALVPVYGFASEALQPIFEFANLNERQEEIYRLIHLGFAKELILAAEYNSATSNPFEYIYRCLGTQLAPLDMNNKAENFEGQLILQYIHNTSPKTSVAGIYRIQGAEEHELTIGNRWLLWHGTKTENLLSILHSGLQIAPLGVDRMGELFGKGIYFADTFAKSDGYTGGQRNRNESTKFIFLCEVALGKIQDVRINSNEVNNHDPGTEKFLQKNFDSSKTADSRYIPDPGATIYWNGKAVPLGSTVEQVFPKNQYYGLNYNEYIIKNPSQVKLRYLVQFTN